MNPLLPLPEQRLFSVTVENVTIEFLAEQPEADTKQITSLTRHDHAYIELFACASGNVVIDTDSGETVLGAGDVAIVPAHFRHILVDSASFGIRAVVGITFIHRYMQSGMNLYAVLQAIAGNGEGVRIEHCAELCNAVVALTNASAESESCLPALRLVLLLVEAAEQKSKPERPETAMSCVGANLDRISRLDYLINSSFMCELAAKDVAESLFISERQLMRITKKRYGTTFRQALLNKRLDVAAKLLCETGDSAAEISRKVGFHSISHFYRSFDKRFGQTPNAYRIHSSETPNTSFSDDSDHPDHSDKT